MERNTGVRRSFLWGVVFWEGRRVLVQAAVAEHQRLSSQNIRHLFLMGLETGSLKLWSWLGPGSAGPVKTNLWKATLDECWCLGLCSVAKDSGRSGGARVFPKEKWPLVGPGNFSSKC